MVFKTLHYFIFNNLDIHIYSILYIQNIRAGADPAFYWGGRGRKIGEGSGDRLGPQRVQGRALVEGPGGEAPPPPGAPAFWRFGDPISWLKSM